MADDEDRRRFHVDADRRVFLQLVAELLIVFPHAAVRRVDHAGSIVEAALYELLRYEFVQFERRQGRDERRQIVVRCALTTDGANRQNEVTDIGGVLQTAALTK